MEDPFLSDQFDIMDFFDEELSATLGYNFHSSLSPEGNSSFSNLIPRSSSTTTLCVSSAMEVPPVSNLCASSEVPPVANLCASSAMEAPPVGIERPSKQLKRNGYSSSPIILTFGNPSTPKMNRQQVNLGTLNPEDDAVSEVLTSQGSFANLDEATKSLPAKKKGRTRPASQTYDHIIAERKRREQLSQRFVALSAMVPGLKKVFILFYFLRILSMNIEINLKSQII